MGGDAALRGRQPDLRSRRVALPAAQGGQDERPLHHGLGLVHVLANIACMVRLQWLGGKPWAHATVNTCVCAQVAHPCAGACSPGSFLDDFLAEEHWWCDSQPHIERMFRALLTNCVLT